MGELLIASINSGQATLTVEWRDNNFRFSNASVHNGLTENVAVEILDENGEILFQQSIPPGDFSQNLPGSVNRFVILTDEGTDAFEIEFVGIKGISFGIG